MRPKLYSLYRKVALLIGGLLIFTGSYLYAQDYCDYSLYQEEVTYWQSEYSEIYSRLLKSESKVFELEESVNSELAEVITIGTSPSEIETEITVFYYENDDSYNHFDLR